MYEVRVKQGEILENLIDRFLSKAGKGLIRRTQSRRYKKGFHMSDGEKRRRQQYSSQYRRHTE